MNVQNICLEKQDLKEFRVISALEELTILPNISGLQMKFPAKFFLLPQCNERVMEVVSI